MASEIARACDGLTYISETDAPFLPFVGGRTDDVTADEVCRQAGSCSDVKSETVDPVSFFARQTAIEDWYDEERKVNAKRFLELQKLLEEDLRELKVFKIGRIRLDIFVVGIDKNGRLMGVRTKAVET